MLLPCAVHLYSINKQLNFVCFSIRVPFLNKTSIGAGCGNGNGHVRARAHPTQIRFRQFLGFLFLHIDPALVAVAGVVEWKNALMLPVNVGGSQSRRGNRFLEGGSRISWFAIHKMFGSAVRGVVALFEYSGM